MEASYHILKEEKEVLSWNKADASFIPTLPVCILKRAIFPCDPTFIPLCWPWKMLSYWPKLGFVFPPALMALIRHSLCDPWFDPQPNPTQPIISLETGLERSVRRAVRLVCVLNFSYIHLERQWSSILLHLACFDYVFIFVTHLWNVFEEFILLSSWCSVVLFWYNTEYSEEHICFDVWYKCNFLGYRSRWMEAEFHGDIVCMSSSEDMFSMRSFSAMSCRL
jgi:hypothetical protein